MTEFKVTIDGEKTIIVDGILTNLDDLDDPVAIANAQTEGGATVTHEEPTITVTPSPSDNHLTKEDIAKELGLDPDKIDNETSEEIDRVLSEDLWVNPGDTVTFVASGYNVVVCLDEAIFGIGRIPIQDGAMTQVEVQKGSSKPFTCTILCATLDKACEDATGHSPGARKPRGRLRGSGRGTQPKPKPDPIEGGKDIVD